MLAGCPSLTNTDSVSKICAKLLYCQTVNKRLDSLTVAVNVSYRLLSLVQLNYSDIKLYYVANVGVKGAPV